MKKKTPKNKKFAFRLSKYDFLVNREAKVQIITTF